MSFTSEMVLFTSRRQKGLAALSHDWYNKSDLAPWEGIKLKRLIRIGAVLAFLAVGAAVLLYLNAFTQSGENFRYLDWISASVVSADGGETPFEPLAEPPALDEGAYYRFSAVLPEHGEPEYLVFETTGLALSLSLDGRTLYSSASVLPEELVELGQILLPIPAGAGETLTVDCRVLEPTSVLFPPLIRLARDPQDTRGAMAAANHYGISAGASSLVWLLAWGMFLMGLVYGNPNWSLLPLSLAAAILTVYYPAIEGGWYFLPQGLVSVLSWPGFRWLIPLCLAAFLAMNRRRDFWRSLGVITAWSVGLLAGAWLVSRIRSGSFAAYLEMILVDAFQSGVFSVPLYWFVFWLTTVCTCLSALTLVRAIYAARASVQTLQIKNNLIMENYQTLLEKNTETLRLRHEWKKQLLSLHLLQERGDLDGLGARLKELDDELDRLTLRLYTDNLAINTILQKAAAQAERQGILFVCQIQVPRELNINEADLCTLLVNLLDNALEAAAQVQPPGKREILCRIRLSRGFLAIHCENTYCGAVHLDRTGQPVTTKADPEQHSFGLVQMRAVAEKYNSVLDISYDQNRFTVQTALALPD